MEFIIYPVVIILSCWFILKEIKGYEVAGYLVQTDDGILYSFFKQRIHALCRQEEWKACGYNNVSITVLYKR